MREWNLRLGDHVWSIFDVVVFKIILRSVGALVSKWPLTQKRLQYCPCIVPRNSATLESATRTTINRKWLSTDKIWRVLYEQGRLSINTLNLGPELGLKYVKKMSTKDKYINTTRKLLDKERDAELEESKLVAQIGDSIKYWFIFPNYRSLPPY